MKRDATTTLQELKALRAQFIADRGWQSSRTPRNVATSIALEAAELLEHFQWGEGSSADRQELASELADIVSYCLDFATALDIDITAAFLEKLEHAKAKYPTELFNKDRPGWEDYRRIKQTYRKDKAKP